MLHTEPLMHHENNLFFHDVFFSRRLKSKASAVFGLDTLTLWNAGESGAFRIWRLRTVKLKVESVNLDFQFSLNTPIIQVLLHDGKEKSNIPLGKQFETSFHL